MLASPEASDLWESFREARAAAPPFDLIRDRETASRAGEIIPPPYGITYSTSTMAGTPTLRVVPTELVSDVPVLWIHGGAFTMLSAHAFRHWAGYLAAELRRPVLIPDYSLAPEYPFPTALDEIVRVYLELARIHPDRPIVVVADSSGGALGVGLQLRLRRDGSPQPALTVLLCPWLDLTLTNPSISANAHLDTVLDASMIHFYTESYLNGTGPTHPFASPAHADLEGIGSLFIMAAEYDILADDALGFAHRCAKAGVEAHLEIAPELPHCYQFFVGVIPEADAALSRIVERILCHGERWDSVL